MLRVVSFPASLWSFRSPRASSPRGTSYRLPEHDGSAVLSFLASLFGPTRQVGRGYILSQMLVLLSFFSLLAIFGFGCLFSVARYLCVGLRGGGLRGVLDTPGPAAALPWSLQGVLVFGSSVWLSFRGEVECFGVRACSLPPAPYWGKC